MSTCLGQPGQSLGLSIIRPNHRKDPRSAVWLLTPSVMAATHCVPSFDKFFPLRDPSDQAIEGLYKSLWKWEDCARCGNKGSCPGDCPWVIRINLNSYQVFFRKLTLRYTSENWRTATPAFQNHDDLHRLVRFIVERPSTPKGELLLEYFGPAEGNPITDTDQNRAFDIAYTTITMLPCARKNPFHCRNGRADPVTWTNSQSACEVFENEFEPGHPLNRDELRMVTASLSAQRLQNRRLRLINTNDPRLHLILDSNEEQVNVFHQVGFLKGCLASNAQCGITIK